MMTTKTNPHQISMCTMCRHKGVACQAGYELIARLNKAMMTAGDSLTEDFEISGTATLTGCDRPCLVAYHSSLEGSYLFGDIDPDVIVDDLVSYAKYACDNNGIQTKDDVNLQQIPAAMIATKPMTMALN